MRLTRADLSRFPQFPANAMTSDRRWGFAFSLFPAVSRHVLQSRATSSSFLPALSFLPWHQTGDGRPKNRMVIGFAAFRLLTTAPKRAVG